MKLFFVLSLLLIVQVHGKYNTKIVGGYRANIKQYPYLAAIVMSKTEYDGSDCLCGGTIVTSRWILTAGHCCVMSKHKEYMSIIVGSTNCYNMTGNFQKIPVIDFVVHPMFSMEADGTRGYHTYNDIALMLLKTNIRTELAKPVKLATYKWLSSRDQKKMNNNCVAMGWGMQAYGKTRTPPYLFAVKLPLYDVEKCHKIYNEEYYKLPLEAPVKFDTTKAVCTLYPGGGKDVCTGDSGGPLICDGRQIGVVSMGYDCAKPGVPNIWTRVDRFYYWILKTTANVKMNSQSAALKFSKEVVLVFILEMLNK